MAQSTLFAFHDDSIFIWAYLARGQGGQSQLKTCSAVAAVVVALGNSPIFYIAPAALPSG
jgi:hypothetical protein